MCTIIGGGIRIASAVDLPVIYVDPEVTNTARGSDFTIDINIANVTWANTNGCGVYCYQFDMSFNTSLVKVVDIMEGPWLQSTWEDTLFTAGWDNKEGELLATNFMPDFPDEGVIGSGTLANITFTTGEAETEGTCPLGFTKTSLRYWNWTGYDYDIIEHTSENGSVTVDPGYDVAVLNITAPPKASVGSTVPINVTVKNQGSFTENGNVTLYYNTTEIETQSFTSLASGANTTASFTWNTAGRTPGPYILNATSTIPVENDTTDNSETKPITLVEHDITVTNIDAPTKVTIETTATIKVTVENLGLFTEAFNLTLSYNPLIGFNDTVELPAGESTIFSFSWNTSGIAEAAYTLNATATILPTIQNPSGTDDDPTDNSRPKPITLQLVHDIAPIDITAEALAASSLPVNVKVENQGSFAENASVSLWYMNTTSGNFTFIDSKNVTLALLTNTTVTVTWDTTDLPPDVYFLMANATILSSPQNPIPENDDLNDDLLYKSVYVSPIECDANGDGSVNASDLSDFAEAYGSQYRPPPGTSDPNWDITCDFNWDRIVNISDLFKLGKNYGQTS